MATAALLDAFLNYLGDVTDPGAASFIAEIDPEMQARTLPPHALPCLRFLPRAVEIAPAAEGVLAAALQKSASRMHWGQTYDEADFGAAFLAKYGWIELFGTRGHFKNAHIAGGFLVLGPDTTYPDHHHVAEEIYIPLTPGTDWRMAVQPYATRKAGEIIHHGSNVPHAMRTSAEPLLALYLWRGGPLAERSTIVGA